MNFCSDNVTGVAPEIMAALAAANAGAAMGYGNDDLTRRVEKLVGELFETDAAVFPVATGTAVECAGARRSWRRPTAPSIATSRRTSMSTNAVRPNCSPAAPS